MKKTTLVAFLLCATQFLHSQSGISAAGNQATGTGGTIHYTIGQLFFTNLTGSDGTTISEGVQQQYEKRTFTFNNSWLPSNPIGLSFAEDELNVISGDVTISSSNTYFDTLTINPGASVTVSEGATISASSATILNSTSNSFSSLIVKGSINGTVNYNRYTALIGSAVNGTNDLISAPVVDQIFGDFATANTNLAASNTLRAFAPYNTVAGAYENYDTNTNANTALTAGIVFRAATTDGSALKFTGTVRTNDVNVPIVDAAAGNGWNLIGNPYPSYINFLSFFTENKTQFHIESAYQAVYGYNGNSANSWTVWNLATAIDPAISAFIAPGQGFFVKAKATGGAVKFTPAMQTIGSTDDFILGKQTNLQVALSKLRLNNASASATTSIYFIEGTTRGLDSGYDAATFDGNSADFSIFSNLVDDNTGIALAIQSLPYTDFNDVVVPLVVNATAATLTIGLDNSTTTIPSHIHVYLEDRVANTYTLLTNTDYTFTPSTDLKGARRFFIRYSAKALATETSILDNVQIYNTASPREIKIKGILNRHATADLYDVQGRLVLRQALKHTSSTNTIDASRLSAGVYVIKVCNDDQIKTQKLFIQ
ncbi:MAG: T9SS type A sorting domain-containing protein [Polaribacter sp.]|nr:T9SS type A sorting domain-containing protein [Polaribacter sp.]